MAAPTISIKVPLGLPAQGVTPPPPPANPPTFADIANAHKYNQRIEAAIVAANHANDPDTPRPSPADVAEGLIYEKTLIELQASATVAPAWFQAWDRDSFQPFAAQIKAYQKISTQSTNGRRATGHQVPFVVLTFTDGSDPTTAPHLLPALNTLDDVRALTETQSGDYAVGYGLAPAGDHPNRQRLIARHIGFCGVLL
ncbi:hypothetical protein C8J57DRAFT_1731353 [Mycena rebaudengoi]|nr:hypothetical protein C8J57DRAFT_1731353 [Mycena rebaudengoi]